MADLIEQMNMLRNLGDDQLAAEMTSPTGGAAPFMVAAELNRRKDMRTRYQALAANRAPSTTVAADLLSSMGGSSMSQPMGGPGMPDNPSGMPAAPQQGIAAAPPGFASGGLVDALDYGAISKQYTDDLAETAKAKDRAAAMALIAAGAGIMGGGHSNTLQNIGLGVNAGLTSYQDQLKDVSTTRTDLLRGVEALAAAQHGDALTRMQLDQQKQISDDQIAAGKGQTAAVRDYEYYKALPPEEQATFLKLNPPVNPNQLTNDQLLGTRMDAIYQDAQKKYPIQQFDTEEEAAKKQQKAQIDAYQRIKGTFGQAAADQWAVGMGIPVGDLVTTDAGSIVSDNPMGLDLPAKSK